LSRVAIVRSSAGIVTRRAKAAAAAAAVRTVAAVSRARQNKRALTKSLKGGFFFHPSDEDLSLGAPDGKSHLAASLSGYSYSDFAITFYRLDLPDEFRAGKLPQRIQAKLDGDGQFGPSRQQRFLSAEICLF